MRVREIGRPRAHRRAGQPSGAWVQKLRIGRKGNRRAPPSGPTLRYKIIDPRLGKNSRVGNMISAIA